MYIIGYDLGSSSLKTALVEAKSGKVVALVKTPATEMEIAAPRKGWAEQDPSLWWECVCRGTREILSETGVSGREITGVGIAYQMHGLVALDSKGTPVRPSIIWCDSRAVDIGDATALEIGELTCRSRLLNEPGNFTGSKLRWMQLHEPENFYKTKSILLPGDYIAFRLSGALQTTASGLSEATLWDFSTGQPAWWLLEHWGIPRELLPEVVPTFGVQAKISDTAARETGLSPGTPILYRAGDQPNNAFTLNVLEPGELAASGGTSGVLFGVSDHQKVRELRRFNHFAHVNHGTEHTRIGQLLCINGAGISYRWLKGLLGEKSYADMDELAGEIPPGSEGVLCFPFGNGVERMLENMEVQAGFEGINFNRHNKGHLCRAVLEGVAFSFKYGMEIMANDGIRFRSIRAGYDNLFQSEVFTVTLAALGETPIELYKVTGAVGAARACLVTEMGMDQVRQLTAARDYLKTANPPENKSEMQHAYSNWKSSLHKQLKQ